MYFSTNLINAGGSFFENKTNGNARSEKIINAEHIVAIIAAEIEILFSFVYLLKFVFWVFLYYKEYSNSNYKGNYQYVVAIWKNVFFP